MNKQFSLFFFCTVLLIFAGCGEKLPDGMPPLYPVSIHLTYEDGTPMADTFLSFKPESGPRNWSVSATTDAKGNAEVRTHGRYKGMPAGKWKITLEKEKLEGIPDPGVPSPDDPESVKKYEEWMKSSDKEKIFSLVEDIYREKSTTPLAINVEKASSFNFKAGKPCKILLPNRNQ